VASEREARLSGRISLEEIPGDWATVSDIVAWLGVGESTVYEWCRSGVLGEEVVRFGRQIRIPKKSLARLLGGE